MVIDRNARRGMKPTVPILHPVEVVPQNEHLVDQVGVLTFHDGQASVPKVCVQKLNRGNLLGFLSRFGGKAKALLNVLDVELSTTPRIDDDAFEVVLGIKFNDLGSRTNEVQLRFLKAFDGNYYIGGRAVTKNHESGSVHIPNVHPQDVPPILNAFRHAMNKIIIRQVEDAVFDVADPLPEILSLESRVLLTKAVLGSLFVEKLLSIGKVDVFEQSPMVSRPRYLTFPSSCLVEVSMTGGIRRAGHYNLPFPAEISERRFTDLLNERVEVPLERLSLIDDEQRATNTAVALDFSFVTCPAEPDNTPIREGAGKLALAELTTEVQLSVDLLEHGPDVTASLRHGESDVEDLAVWVDEPTTQKLKAQSSSLPATPSTTSYHSRTAISDEVKLPRKRKFAKVDF